MKYPLNDLSAPAVNDKSIRNGTQACFDSTYELASIMIYNHPTSDSSALNYRSGVTVADVFDMLEYFQE